MLHKKKFVSLHTLVDATAGLWLLWGWYVICASHFHYTVDVMVGALMTFLMVWGYHGLVKKFWMSADPYTRGVSNPVSKLVQKLVQWFECYSPDLKYWRLRVKHLLAADEIHVVDSDDDFDNISDIQPFSSAEEDYYILWCNSYSFSFYYYNIIVTILL